jgi:hypothetical protein
MLLKCASLKRRHAQSASSAAVIKLPFHLTTGNGEMKLLIGTMKGDHEKIVQRSIAFLFIVRGNIDRRSSYKHSGAALNYKTEQQYVQQ